MGKFFSHATGFLEDPSLEEAISRYPLYVRLPYFTANSTVWRKEMEEHSDWCNRMTKEDWTSWAHAGDFYYAFLNNEDKLLFELAFK